MLLAFLIVQSERSVFGSGLFALDFEVEYGGGTGIRTLEGCYTLLVFKTSAFNRSAIPPATRMMTK